MTADEDYGDFITFFSTDINECMNSPCSTFAVCQNTVGSFSCSCNAGFTGNGLSCLGNIKSLILY